MNNTEIVNAILASRTATVSAYEHVELEMKALDESEVRLVNVDPPASVARVLGALEKIRPYREDIAKLLGPEMQQVDKLEVYAFALQEAHVRSLSAGKTPDDLRALAEAGDALRAMLRSDGAALTARGLIDPARLESCTGQPGYKVIATELGVLSAVFLSVWPQIQGKCCVTEQELQRAQLIADALLAYVGVRDKSPEARAEALAMRGRAFTLLVNKYDIARRAVTFLRWNEGDADDIAPSLFAGKQRGKDKTDAQPQEPIATPPGSPPATGSTPTAGPTPPAASGGNSQPVVTTGPQGSPFMH